MQQRDYNYEILPEIKQRYATKNFSGQVISRGELLPIFEAARYAPSAFNEQPWRFLVGDTPEVYDKLAQTLVPGNAWAKRAPVLILVLCTKPFKYNGEYNAHSRFDTGTASGFLQLEAARQGFVTHCMSGFDAELARELFQIPEELDIIELIALGRPAVLSELPEEQQKEERPGTRNPLESFFWNP